MSGVETGVTAIETIGHARIYSREDNAFPSVFQASKQDNDNALLIDFDLCLVDFSKQNIYRIVILGYENIPNITIEYSHRSKGSRKLISNDFIETDQHK